MVRTKAVQHSLLFDRYDNCGLFADNYLESEHRLLALAEWQEPDGLAEALSEITTLFEEHASHFTSDTNEAQTEADFIRPVLKRLGWEYEVQEPIAGVNKTPDYALLTSREEWEAIQELKGTPELWEHCAAVGDAKRWKQDLDKKRQGENPSLQITNYLFRSRVRWGILTNGAKWRLYEQDRSRGGGIYYEVDLLSILQSQDPEAFKYFYLFFRKDAFLPVRDEKSFVEIVYEDSERYRTEVGDSLKEAVYDALRHLMNGFFRYPDNQLDPDDADQLKQVHDLSLVLLYRIIFLLYAEDMDLLPAGTQPYADYSMVRLQKQINSHLRSGARYVSGARGLWHDLLDRFALIDQGLSDNGERIIPAYNGGLFSCQRDPEIAYERQPEASRWEIGDYYLAEAIDLLAYQRESWHEPGSQTVDYATLGVQHLGAIYEGLLELKPQIASEPMIEQPGKSGKPPVVKEKSDVEEPKKVRGQTPREFGEGEIYLVTDRGERKATGSYYTPKYIVDYIVEHTVGELAEQAAEEVASRWEDMSEQLGISAPEQWPELLAAADQEYERRELEEQQRWLLAPYLDLKILDPAIGSGHFLVGASDHLSLAMATDPHLPPVPPEEESDVQTYYKRLIVEHCLYGVDLNPLAVELAKLSLWLHTVSKDKALSFLDHHLRCGNSLIGARLQEDLTRVPPPLGGGESKETVQIPLGFDETLEERDLAAFLDTFRKIVEAPTGNAETERDKDRWFTEMDRHRDRYRQVANLWLAPYFEVEVTADQYSQALEALRDGAGSEEWQTLTKQDWFRAAQEVAGERNFFHWELEFPEAFFTVQDSQAIWRPEDEQGFDAVIGNPPYVKATQHEERLVELREVLQNWSAFRWLSGKWDVCVAFLERGFRLLRHDALISLIVTNAIETSPYAQTFRAQAIEEACVERIDFFPGIRLFPEVGIHNTIVLLRAAIPTANAQVTRLVHTSADGPPKLLPTLNQGEAGESVFNPHAGTALEPPTDGISIEELYYVSVGMVLNADEKRAPGAFRKGDIVADEPSERFRRPYLEADQIGRYWVGRYRYLEFGTQRVPKLLRRPTFPELYDAPKLLMPRHLGGTYDEQGSTVDQRTIILKPWHTLNGVRNNSIANEIGRIQETRGISRKDLERMSRSVCSLAVLAVLNSKCYTYYLSTSAMRDTIDATPDAFRQTLLPRLRLEDSTDKAAKEKLLQRCQKTIAEADYETPYELARQALATHALLHGPAGKEELRDDEYWAAEIKRADPDFPGGEDFVHDLLAELAQSMIDLNKEKHQLIEQFETDLRGAAAEELHEKLKKGKQGRSLYKHESCQPYVEQDSHTTHHLPETLAWSAEAFEDFLRELIGKTTKLSDFLTVYEKYAEDYREVTDALTKTDHLIDQIVYALYGLTEEEIGIVEETVV